MDFLVAAVKDLADDRPSTRLKFGLVSLFIGIEVLLKVRLAREHWSLVFENVSKANKIAHKNGNFKSIHFNGAINRLSSICSVKFTEDQEKALDRLRNERNKLIHIGYMDQQSRLRPVAAKTLDFVITFISEELEPDGLEEGTADLLDQIRSGLATIRHYVIRRRQSIKPILDASRSRIVQCPRCLENAMIFHGVEPKCAFCDHTPVGENAADLFVHDVLGISMYEVVSKGGEWPLHMCSECGKNALIEGVDRILSMPQRWACFACGIVVSDEDVWPCVSCDDPVIAPDGPPVFCDMCSYT